MTKNKIREIIAATACGFWILDNKNHKIYSIHNYQALENLVLQQFKEL